MSNLSSGLERRRSRADRTDRGKESILLEIIGLPILIGQAGKVLVRVKDANDVTTYVKFDLLRVLENLALMKMGNCILLHEAQWKSSDHDVLDIGFLDTFEFTEMD
ncbi:unnamed protein product [Lymnaea stagnalis]|uniref:Uncharacterized protein n=1 Tax=Lymnaea stagnalis TaxID=6523 RepID=A0AAV2H6R9_LYMST